MRKHPLGNIVDTLRRVTTRRRDRALWAAASTMVDIGELTAQWLEGTIGYHPGYPGVGPDPETTTLIPTLAAVNRAGFVTDGSQPGMAPRRGYGEWTWAQRPAVEGWIPAPLAAVLTEQAEAAGFLAIRYPPNPDARTRVEDGITVTTINGQWCTVFGRQIPPSDVRDVLFSGVGAAAVGEVLGADRLTIVDPDYTADTRLWRLLDEWATHRSSANAREAV